MSGISSPKFYEVMNYPLPIHFSYYRYISEQYKQHTPSDQTIDYKFSRFEKTDLMKSYTEILSTKMKFLKHIPFISQIYLCNSITFNALHPGSDIDICIVTKPGFLWYARAWSRLFFSLLKLKRSAGHGDHTEQFCLSFYIDGNDINIKGLRIPEGDIYLSYRLAHTVLLYTDNTYADDYIRSHNKELLSYLPNHPLTQTIFLDISIVRGISLFKKISEVICSSLPGKWIQYGIKKIWGDIINIYKTQQLPPHTKSYIITSPTMLKFYTDKRIVYQHKRKSASSKSISYDNHSIAHK